MKKLKFDYKFTFYVKMLAIANCNLVNVFNLAKYDVLSSFLIKGL